MTYCLINGQITAAASATISIQDRGYRFGDGVFESIAVHQGVPYQFEWHLKRMQEGLKAIKIQYDASETKEQCRQLLHHNNFKEGIMRIQVTRGNGSRGYLPAIPAPVPNTLIETNPFPDLQQFDRSRMALWVSSYTKMSAKALPVQYKLCQGLNSTLARMEAIENECFDAVLLNEAGHVCETSSGNIFWQKNGEIFTPSLHCGVLAGSTRAAILRLNPHIRETEAPLSELLNADAVCATNIVWKALPVTKCKPSDILWKNVSFADALTDQLDTDCKLYTQNHSPEWL